MYRVLIACFLMYTTLHAAHCWQIRNEDKRHLCESKFEGKKSCWLIKENDMKAYCEATAEHKNSCWLIKENDLRQMCRAETGF
ncbi:hypothetical protein [Sulfurovum sp. NBC37-1]|uniref:hypothetical protein n=1 Tax=Sulfurovum sp. (strain NBC37-1) TaxID=387093 RepID=UPI0001587673|nr:hypothetical protein [Sulfurovum sp. NBC37-1]BAF71547.1 conserved hypothetical protein [Sulfurovum sp. NBC37-1]